MTQGDPDRRFKMALSRRAFVRGGGLLVAGAAFGLAGGRHRLLQATGPAADAAVEEAAREAAGGEKVELPALPRQVLGRTGLEVTALGLGTALLGHQNDNKPEIPKLVEVFGEAIDRGINYIDTARMYGGAEKALKTVLQSRRDKVYLATKVWTETRDEAEKLFHESLAELGVDKVDILHLHNAGDKNLDKVLGPGGSWEFLEQARKEGKARFLGITGHSRPLNFLRLLETGKVDVMMVAMNFVDRHVYGFEEKVLPLARRQRTGILAMKVYGGVRGGFKNYPSKTPHPSQMEASYHRRAIGYIKALDGVAGMVIGVHSREQLLENIRRVAEIKPLSKAEFDLLCEEGKALAPSWQARFGPVA